jgi:hypothetical protein
MPHDQPWLDDYHAKAQAELQEQWKENADIMETQNRAIRTVLNECPFELRTPEICMECGNEKCHLAWKEQNKLWDQPEDQKLPVSVVRHTNISTPKAELKSNAQKDCPEKTSCQLLGQPASGLSLFDLINQLPESEEEAA